MADSYPLQIAFENLFPTNPSLADDLCRLFMTTTKLNASPAVAHEMRTTCDYSRLTPNAFEAPPSPVLEEFRRLGRDSEYCPEFISVCQNYTSPGRPVFRKKPKKMATKVKECVFCKNNGETQDVYASHILKDAETGKIVCPILRAYTCPLCGAKGDTAHTIKYCPNNVENKMRANSKPMSTMTVIRNSFGRCRLKCT